MTDADGYDKINIFKYIKRLEKHLICKSAYLRHVNMKVALLISFMKHKSYVCNIK